MSEHCKNHYDPLDGDPVEYMKKQMDECIERGHWFEISDCSAYDLREYIRKLERWKDQAIETYSALGDMVVSGA